MFILATERSVFFFLSKLRRRETWLNSQPQLKFSLDRSASQSFPLRYIFLVSAEELPPRNNCIFSAMKTRHSLLDEISLTYNEKFSNGSADITTINATDLTRWRLLDERGRQTWHYLATDEEVQAWPQSLCDKHHLDLPLVSIHRF